MSEVANNNPSSQQAELTISDEDIVNGGVWGNRFEVFRPSHMQFELFGMCTPHQCLRLGDGVCEHCLRAYETRQSFFQQRFESVMMVRPALMRRFFNREPLIVPYLSVFHAYYLLVKYFDRLFNPTNVTLHEGDSNWIPWTERMYKRRVVANYYFIARHKTFADGCTVADTRVKLLNAFERMICFCMSVMEMLNRITDNGILTMVSEIEDETDGDGKGSTVSQIEGAIYQVASEISSTYCEDEILEVKKAPCKADMWQEMMGMQDDYNRKLRAIIATWEDAAKEEADGRAREEEEPKAESKVDASVNMLHEHASFVQEQIALVNAKYQEEAEKADSVPRWDEETYAESVRKIYGYESGEKFMRESLGVVEYAEEEKQSESGKAFLMKISVTEGEEEEDPKQGPKTALDAMNGMSYSLIPTKTVAEEVEESFNEEEA